ncbi:Ldh family oxidoreductase [Virgibacillus oceani]
MKSYEISIDEYMRSGIKLLELINVQKKDAETIIASLLESDLRGIHTHGLFRLPRYMEQIKDCNINPQPNIRTCHTNQWLEVLDGDHGPGAVVAKRAMKRAIMKSKDIGIGASAVHNGNHFGVAAYYAEMASLEGKIGIVMTNSSPAIAPTGSLKRLIGNNPWSISVPGIDNPITLDIANSVVSKGKLRVARDRNEKIPLNWALDSKGNPTDDPEKALEGIVLPIGDYKGYGIALLVEILAGVLTGADFSERMVDHDADQKRNVGHLFIVMDVESFMPMNDYQERVKELVNSIKNAPVIKDKNVYLPGEMEWINKNKNNLNNVSIPKNTIKSYLELCRQFNVSTNIETIF